MEEAAEHQVDPDRIQLPDPLDDLPGVPINPVLKPSLYCTRSSKVESAHMPFPSGDALPACFTCCRNPSTASRSAYSMIRRSSASASAWRRSAMTKALTPNRTLRPSSPSEGGDLLDLLLQALERVAVHEVPVGDPGRHAPGGLGVAALKDLRRILYGPGLERRRVDAVEVAFKLKGLPAQRPRSTRTNSSERRYRSSCSSHGSPNPVNSCLNQPLTMLTANRPWLNWSMVAPLWPAPPDAKAQDARRQSV